MLPNHFVYFASIQLTDNLSNFYKKADMNFECGHGELNSSGRQNKYNEYMYLFVKLFIDDDASQNYFQLSVFLTADLEIGYTEPR